MNLRLVDYISIFIAVFIVSPTLWFLVDRNPPYEIISGRVHPQEATPGSDIEVVWHVRSVRLCSLRKATVTRTIVDSVGIAHRYVPTPAAFEGEIEIERTISLSPALPLGPARYSSLSCYPCNPLQELWPVCVQTPEISFTVVAGPGQIPAETKGSRN